MNQMSKAVNICLWHNIAQRNEEGFWFDHFRCPTSVLLRLTGAGNNLLRYEGNRKFYPRKKIPQKFQPCQGRVRSKKGTKIPSYDKIIYWISCRMVFSLDSRWPFSSPHVDRPNAPFRENCTLCTFFEYFRNRFQSRILGPSASFQAFLFP